MTENKLKSVSKGIDLGVFWLLSMRLLLKSISVISTLILVRLLVPEDFGLVALAMSFYALIELFSAFGFEAALVQTRNPSDEHYSTIWTIRFIFSAFMCLLINLGAPYVADFYADDSLEFVIRVTSFLFILKAITNTGMIKFIKEMDFKTEFKYQAITKLSSFIITISFAFWLKNFYALIIGMYASTLISVALSYKFSKFKPTFCLSRTKELFKFSKWMVINAWLNYLNSRTGEIVIGYFGSSKSVGLFNVSNEIAMLPSAELGSAINRSSYSGYAKAEGDLLLLRQLFINVLNKTSFVTIATGIGIYLLAYEISHWLLGPGWESTQEIFEYIALSSIFSAFSTNPQYICMALGKPKLTTLLSAIRVGILFTLLIPLTKERGIIGAAEAFFLTSVIYLPLPVLVAKRLIRFSFVEYFKAIYIHLFAAVVMATTLMLGFSQIQFEQDFLYLAVMLKVFIGVSVFSMVLFLGWWFSGKSKDSPEGMLFHFFSDKLLKVK